MGWTLHMIMCVLLCYPVSIRIYYQQGVLFLVFLFFAKHKNAYILKTVLDRADCADFGCHTSIRLETKHFLNTLALAFISFSGRFVFAMQKHYLFFLRAIL